MTGMSNAQWPITYLYGAYELVYDLENIIFGIKKSKDRIYERWKYKIFHRGVSGFVSGCPGGVSCRVLTTFRLFVGPNLGNSILYKLVRTFDRIQNSFSSLCKYMSIVTIDIHITSH